MSVSEKRSTTKMLRVTAAGFAGTALEYYDFFLYGTAAALVFGPLFSRHTARWRGPSPPSRLSRSDSSLGRWAVFSSAEWGTRSVGARHSCSRC